MPVNPRERKFSTRLIRKGALLEETHRVFLAWDLSRGFDENISRARENNTPGTKNSSWLKEVMATIVSRWRNHFLLQPLVNFAKKSDYSTWKPAVLWHIGQIDSLYYHFSVNWLYQEYTQGAFRLRSKDVCPFVEKITREKTGNELSDYGRVRAARDLLRMSTDFGLLEGSAFKEFRSFHLETDTFLYILHGMFETHGNAFDLINSKDWRLFLMRPPDVEREIYRLHQFRQLRFEVAGSLMELTLPYKTAAEYVEEMQS